MSVVSTGPKVLLAFAVLTGTATASYAVQAQTQDPPEADVTASADSTPRGEAPQTSEGPDIEGFISARSGDRMQVTSADGQKSVITINDATRISASKGLFGLGHSKIAADSLLNGIPVSVKTMQSGDGLIASQIKLHKKDLRTASMIHTGTAQGFAEQTAATEALRGRMADIDKYNIKQTVNVNFDTGKAVLSPEAKNALCATATSAEGIDNALLLVIGYTDSTGSEDFNQDLSDKRAGRVVHYLQQACGWKPYRMLTPTGMSESNPVASNDTAQGKAENRRVAVNVLVSKGLDGL